MTWAIAAAELQKKFIGFKSYAEFNAYKEKLDHSQRVYLDSHLGNGAKGEEIAQALYAQGFNNLYLATGFAADAFKDLSFIKAVVGKEPPKN